MRVTSLAVAVCLSVVGFVAAQDAEAIARRQTNIAAQGLGPALQNLARERGFQVVYLSDSVDSQQTAGAVGEFTDAEAIETLLRGTGLTYRYVDGETVTILPVGSRSATSTNNTTTANPSPGTGAGSTTQWGVRVAQNRPENNNQSAQQSDPATSQETPESEKPATNRDDDSELQEVQVSIPEILVKGTRSLNMDIQRTRDGMQPYMILDSESIQRSGARNIEDLLKNQLTASTSFNSNSQGISFFGNTSTINLRGLGANQTLILVDGHRVAGYSFAGIPNQPDVNGIPLSAVERIEVLPATASGIYGGGATGGVVNIVLKRDYTGLEAKLTYGGSFNGGAAERKAEFSGGFDFNASATSVLLTGSYADANELQMGHREFAERGRQRIVNNNPAAIFDSPVPLLGATTNIRSLTGENLTLKSGGVLHSPLTFIPRGYTGVASDGGAALINNAGQYNLALADTAQSGGSRQSLLNSPTIKSFTATLRQHLTDSIQAFLDLSASRNAGSLLSSSAIPILFVADTAPNNPFNQAVFASTPASGADGFVDLTLDTQRAVGGFIFALPASWRAEADYTWNRTRTKTLGPAFDDAAASAAINAGTLNIFRDNGAQPLFAQFVLPPTSADVDTTFNDATIRLSGPLPWLWKANAPTLSTLLEHRKEVIGDFHFIQHVSPTDVSDGFSPERWQSVDSAALELTMPLLSVRNAIRGVGLLELQLAARYDDYKTVGGNTITIFNGIPLGVVVQEENKFSSTDPTVGLRYQPIEGLTVRASYGTGFLPPAVDQLTPELPFDIDAFTAGLLGLTDPLRNNEPLGAFTAGSGGNPDLGPEESTSESAGLILTPRSLPRLRLSLDWTKIRKSDNIAAPSVFDPEDVRSLILFAPERITRAASSGGLPGPVTAINATLLNFSKATVEALDLALDYQWPALSFGRFAFSSSATRLLDNRTQIAPDAPQVDNTGVRGNTRWRANATVTWDYREWSAAWTTRYFSSYWLNAAHDIVLNQGSASVPSQVYHDLYLSYRFDRQSTTRAASLLAGLELDLGINNVFHRSPPPDVTSLDRFYSPLGDPRLSRYILSLRKAF